MTTRIVATRYGVTVTMCGVMLSATLYDLPRSILNTQYSTSHQYPMASVTYKVCILMWGGETKPCPNCFFQRVCPCTSCADFIEFFDNNDQDETHFLSKEVTVEDMEQSFPHLDFHHQPVPGDRVVCDTCSNCYYHHFPCLNCRRSAQVCECCSSGDGISNDRCTCDTDVVSPFVKCRLVSYEEIRQYGRNFPPTYDRYVQQKQQDREAYVAKK